jgi:hypothetical protein
MKLRPILAWLYQITKVFPTNWLKLPHLQPRHPAIPMHLKELSLEIFEKILVKYLLYMFIVLFTEQ